ncbi:MAG TPA: PilZ domain-containing protein [Candidatus Acidoferrales bacterium]|nr:PilZ domain-containing protein [Candidatus Acidoferrales bacterium]
MDSRSNRRSDRISISYTLETMGTNAEGKPFLETARTVVVNRHGALVSLNHKLRVGQGVTVRRRASDGSIRQADVRVVACEKELPNGGEYGVSFVDPNLDFWGIEFPEPERAVDAVVRLLVECTHCRSQELAYLDSRELKEFEANRLFARQCRMCEAPTIWKQPLEAISHAGNGEPRREGAAGAATASPERETTRYETHLTACVRAKPGTEEMAVCENVSRQGIAFRTKNRYEEGSQLEVAVPYTPGMANVFVPAVVIHVRALPAAGLYRHGAKYLRKDATV